MEEDDVSALSDREYFWLLHQASELVQHADIREFMRVVPEREEGDGKKEPAWKPA